MTFTQSFGFCNVDTYEPQSVELQLNRQGLVHTGIILHKSTLFSRGFHLVSWFRDFIVVTDMPPWSPTDPQSKRKLFLLPASVIQSAAIGQDN